jgi:hypothetical protein
MSTINRRSSQLTRRTAISAAAAVFSGVMGGATPPRARAENVRRRAVELTFLKSKPGARDSLKKFIVLNWFAMDELAKQRGLMESFALLDAASDEGAWNLVVQVAYPDERGYDGIVESFEQIRRAHETVRIDGKGLRELGSIVETRRLFADASPVAP